jgi:osmotically-inducible protein OsmY
MTSPTKTRTDEEIHRDVLEELRWDARVQPNEIGVSVKDGVVTLTGWTDSYIKRWSAERAAERVRGVRAVANDIEVRLPATADRTDADIAAAARRALEWSSLVPSDSIRVTVSDGWVTLRGQTNWEFEKREAERVVQRLAGVRGVTNLITVRPRLRAEPAELKRKIEAALVRSAETDAESIEVDVEDDKIVLRGTVRTWAEKEEAERVAWSAPGVTAVDNRIMVLP